MKDELRWVTAFEGQRRIGSGPLPEVAASTKQVIDKGNLREILIFDDQTSELIEVDFRGTVEEVQRRLTSQEAIDNTGLPEPGVKRGPGRPRLGVVGREVTLLPRHWEWLDGQPGGASVALRKLVEDARRSNQGKDCARRAQEAVYRFMSAMTGDLTGFEEALRAFYRQNYPRFRQLVESWPQDLRDHLRKLVATVEKLQRFSI